MEQSKFMYRALELAKKGLGSTSPNPMVGCTIVYQGRIIGEGYHRQYGAAHAEVEAISKVEDLDLLKASVMYVTLEPCDHQGKTPPCTALIIKHKIPRVEIASKDTNKKVKGKGIEALRKAGVEVVVGLLEDEARELNKRFFTVKEQQRPFVVLKWAVSSNGFLGRHNERTTLSNQYSRQLTHRWRTEEDAILVGKHTALIDDPLLTARLWQGRNPYRVLLDSHLQVPRQHHIFSTDASTIVFNQLKDEIEGHIIFKKLGPISPEKILEELMRLRINSVLVEGGGKVLHSFIQSKLWDEARVFHTNTTIERGVLSPAFRGNLTHTEKIFGDLLNIYTNDEKQH